MTTVRGWWRRQWSEEVRAATMAVLAHDERAWCVCSDDAYAVECSRLAMRRMGLASANADFWPEFWTARYNHNSMVRVGKVKAHTLWLSLCSGMVTPHELYRASLSKSVQAALQRVDDGTCIPSHNEPCGRACVECATKAPCDIASMCHTQGRSRKDSPADAKEK